MPRPAARPAALATAVLLSAVTALATVPPAGATTTGSTGTGHDQAFTKTPVTVDVKVGPNRDVPCTVKADLYRPAGVDRTHRAAAILTTNGFGGAKDDEGQSAGASAFAKAGYVVVSYSGLGFGGSDCKITLDDPAYDGVAGKQMVDVLAGTRPYTLDDGTGRQQRVDFVDSTATSHGPDPKVGMIGGSYGGQIQFAVAQQDPRVDAIIPMITWNDLSYSLAPNNTDTVRGVTYATPGVAKKQWIDLFFSLGILSGLQNTQTDPTRNVGCPNFTDQACAAGAQLNAAGYPDQATLDLARHASVASYVSRIKIPTLLVQGQHDTLFNIQEAVATYRALRAQGTEARMSWFSGGHSGDNAAGDLDLSRGVDGSHQGRRWISWMDRYVRGNTAASAGPQFEYFRDWVAYDTTEANAGRAVDRAYATSDTALLRRPHLDAAAHRHRRADLLVHGRPRGEPARRDACRHVVLRDVRGRGQRRQRSGHRRSRHVRGVHLTGAGQGRRARRLPPAHREPRRPGRRRGPGQLGPRASWCSSPSCTTWRPTAPRSSSTG